MNYRIKYDINGTPWVRFNEVYQALDYAQGLGSYMSKNRKKHVINSEMVANGENNYTLFIKETPVGVEYWMPLESVLQRLHRVRRTDKVREEKSAKIADELRWLAKAVKNKNNPDILDAVKKLPPSDPVVVAVANKLLERDKWSEKEQEFVTQMIFNMEFPRETAAALAQRLLS